MIFTHKIPFVLLCTLLLVGCNTLPSITITIGGDDSSKAEAEPITTDSSSISQSEELEETEFDTRSTHNDDSATFGIRQWGSATNNLLHAMQYP